MSVLVRLVYDNRIHRLSGRQQTLISKTSTSRDGQDQGAGRFSISWGPAS